MAGSDASMRMADRLAGGKLKEEIARYRKVRAPWPAIAAHLREQYGVEVTGDTLRLWAERLGVDDASLRAAAAAEAAS
jgi:hypothetical protein